MDPLIKARLLLYAIRVSGPLLWLNRSFYRSALASSRNGLALLLIYSAILILCLVDSAYFQVALDWHEVILATTFCPVLLLCGYLLLGQYVASIVKIDFGAKNGISFEQSMRACKKSFRFIGVGAAKLTELEDPFRLMAGRCIQNGGSPQLLLCNPASPVIAKLEGIAQATRMRFTGKVERSYAALKALEGELSTTFDVRQYMANDYDDMPLFRLIFIDDEFCLFCGGHYGKSDHGVEIPQLLVSRINSPALYSALDRYYKQAWAKATAWDRGTT